MIPELINIICEYVGEGLLHWIDESKLNWKSLSQNPHPTAIEMLKANPKKISWKYLSLNTNVEAQQMVSVCRLTHTMYKIDSWNYSYHCKHRGRVAYSIRDSCIKYPEINHDDMHWQSISGNNSDEAAALIKSMYDKDPNKIDKYMLASNNHPVEIDILEEIYYFTPRKIRWDNLSRNNGALNLIEANLDKINYKLLCQNKSSRAMVLLEDKYKIIDFQ